MSKPPDESSLERLVSFRIKGANPNREVGTPTTFELILARGSVVDFQYKENPSKAAIVNAANEECLSGGGVDGAITSAGGANLFRDRLALPVIYTKYIDREGDESGDESDIEEFEVEIRCPTGEAKLTGLGDYGRLAVSNVIHAVGPNYRCFKPCLEKADELLRSAYIQSLERGREAGLEAVAFCLLSSGIFRGKRSLRQVIQIAIEAIRDFGGYEGLKEVHICAFTSQEADVLIRVAEDLGLERVRDS